MPMDSLSICPPIPANSPLFCSLTVAILGALAAFLMPMDSLSICPPIPANSPLFCSFTVASLGASGGEVDETKGERNRTIERKKMRGWEETHTHSLSNSHGVSSFLAGLSMQFTTNLFVDRCGLTADFAGFLGVAHVHTVSSLRSLGHGDALNTVDVVVLVLESKG